MIALIDPIILAADGAVMLCSTFPGVVGTEELMRFTTEQLGSSSEWITNPGQPDEHLRIRGRSIARSAAAGAVKLHPQQAAEVLRYKRYLHATSPEDRIERRLVARYVLCLFDLGTTDHGLAAEAAAETYGLDAETAAGELTQAIERFSGGYATWRDETGTPEKCGRCDREGATELDVDHFYRCPSCHSDVRAAEAEIEEKARAMEFLGRRMI